MPIAPDRRRRACCARSVPARPGSVVRLDRLARSVRHLLAVIGTVCGEPPSPRSMRCWQPLSSAHASPMPLVCRHGATPTHRQGKSLPQFGADAWPPAAPLVDREPPQPPRMVRIRRTTGDAGGAPRPPTSHPPPNGPRLAHSQGGILTTHWRAITPKRRRGISRRKPILAAYRHAGALLCNHVGRQSQNHASMMGRLCAIIAAQRTEGQLCVCGRGSRNKRRGGQIHSCHPFGRSGRPRRL